MLLMPSKTKYRKQQKGKIRDEAKGGTEISFGEYGLLAVTAGKLKGNQLEASRITINKSLGKEGRIWIRVFPDKPITKQPAETRMGKGKGNVEYYVAVVKPGRVIFEVGGVSEAVAKTALEKAGYKLPVKVKFIKKEQK